MTKKFCLGNKCAEFFFKKKKINVEVWHSG